MRAALRAARLGQGAVSPNPMVGAALVTPDGRIQTAYHARYGGPHAEVRLLDSVTEIEVRRAEIYLTLEPCTHRGKTPPCVDRLVAARPKRVWIASLDPNPEVAGGGVARLRGAGIEVRTGMGEAEAVALNLGFYLRHLRHRALLHLKLAASLDGSIATGAGESKWITGEEARREVHRERSRSDAVVVGAGTIEADDPELTVRHVRGPQPSRIVIDSTLRTSPEARVWRAWNREISFLLAAGDVLEGNHLGRAVDGPGARSKGGREYCRRTRLILATRTGWSRERLQPYRSRGWEVWKLPENRDRQVSLRALIRRAGREGLLRLYVEGGPKLSGALLESDCVDELSLYQAPMVLGGGRCWSGPYLARTLAMARRFAPVGVRRFGRDVRSSFRRESLLEDLIRDVHRSD